MKVFQRACVRGGVEVAHSEGYNPHPRMSLPLPRSVGVESDDELLAFVITDDGDQTVSGELASQIQARLAGQLPDGCEIVEAGAVRGGKTPLPCSASYSLMVAPEYAGDELANRIKDLLAADSVMLKRRAGKKASQPREVDVRGFIRSVELDGGCVSVECEITSTGSIRMEEILDCLGLNHETLAGPIKRRKVSWRN